MLDVYSRPPWRAIRHHALRVGAVPDDPRPRRPTGRGSWRSWAATRRRHDPHHHPRGRPRPARLHCRRLPAAERLRHRRRRLRRLGPATSNSRASGLLSARLLQRLPAGLPVRPLAARWGGRRARAAHRPGRHRWAREDPGHRRRHRRRLDALRDRTPLGARAPVTRPCRDLRGVARPRRRRALPVQPRHDLRLRRVGPDRFGRDPGAAGDDLRPRPWLDGARGARRGGGDAGQVPVRLPRPGGRDRRAEAPSRRPVGRSRARWPAAAAARPRIARRRRGRRDAAHAAVRDGDLRAARRR